MKRLIAALLLVTATPCLANSPEDQGFIAKNITSDATTVLKTAKGVLHEICINKYGASGTIAVYDGVSTSGLLLGTITETATVTSQAPTCVMHDIAFQNGLTIVTGTAPHDLTVIYH
jgi:hypothetical protein